MKLKSLILSIALIFGFGTSAYADHGHDKKTMKDAVKAVGVINSIDVKNHKINISHEPIKAIGWPAMKMDMKVAKAIDLKHIKAGETVDFKVAKGKDGIYMIVDLHHRHGKKKKMKMDSKKMDHSKHKDMKHD